MGFAPSGVWNVRLRPHQQIAGDEDDAFVRAAAGRGRQLADGLVGDVNADHGETAVVEFPEVRAAATCGGLRAVCVRVLAEAFEKSHAPVLTMVRYYVKSFASIFSTWHPASRNKSSVPASPPFCGGNAKNRGCP